ncbi:unnamed protein product, partial [Brenthis ino]
MNAPSGTRTRDCWHKKGDLFWSTTFVVAYRRCGVVSLRGALRSERGAKAPLVSRPRSSVRDVRARGPVALPSLPPPPRPNAAVHTRPPASARERDDRAATETGDMAVSQPRPPDRVDAALEKVAPLRYLKAHEYTSTVTRYHKPLS